MLPKAYGIEQKAAILIENAKAYLNKGTNIQYDQYSMDRIARITPRNTRSAPPEMGNEQHVLFLDCSTFTYAVYYNTFGYRLESNLTWSIPDMVTPCIYHREITHQETPEEQMEIRKQLLELLRPGDLINLVRVSGSGHIVLYVGDGNILHSRSAGPNSYRFDELHDGIYDHGTIYFQPLDVMLDVNLSKRTVFAKDSASFQVLRPLEKVGAPTPAALSRAGKSKDLVFSVLSSHSGGKTAWEGDTVTYTLKVSNVGTQTRRVEGTVKETANLKLLDLNCSYCFDVPAGACVEESFRFRLKVGEAPLCKAPEFVANDIPVWAERVLVGRRIAAATKEEIVSRVSNLAPGADLYRGVVSAYGEAGIVLPDDPFQMLFRVFRLIDSASGDVLWRFPQKPEADMALYSYFGGTGVVTPELCADENIRVKKMWARDLQPGDVIMIAEDVKFRKVHCLFVTAEGILSRFSGEETVFVAGGELAEKLIDSLPGRFCYIVFRPEQQAI